MRFTEKRSKIYSDYAVCCGASLSFRVPDKLLTDGQCKMRINGIGFVQSLLDANGLVTGKDYQFSGRYDIEKNAVVISLEANERGNSISLKEFGASGTL